MPGPTIAKHLKPYTYEQFYEVAHTYSELLLSAAVFIRPSSSIILKQLTAMPPTVFDDKITSPTLERTLTELAEKGEELSAQIRHVFWNYDPSRRIFRDETALEKNRKRWKPYDDAAWDKFFTEVSERLTPILQRLSDLRSPMRLLTKWPDPKDVILEDETLTISDHEKIQGIRNNLERTVDRLQELLDAEALDSIFEKNGSPLGAG